MVMMMMDADDDATGCILRGNMVVAVVVIIPKGAFVTDR